MHDRMLATAGEDCDFWTLSFVVVEDGDKLETGMFPYYLGSEEEELRSEREQDPRLFQKHFCTMLKVCLSALLGLGTRTALVIR